MQAILCKEIIPVTRDRIKNGHILIQDGKIVAIGPGYDVPADAEIIDAKDSIAFPGIIDAHCHATVFEEEIGLSLQDGNEMTDPLTPQIRVLDAINPMERGLRRAVSGGVTCICIAPGSANVVGGQMTTIKTHGKIVDEMVVTPFAGMKCAFGENPKRVYGGQKRTPSTRMGNLGVFRQFMVETQNYMQKQQEYTEKLTEYEEASKEYEAKMAKKDTEAAEDLKKPKKPSPPDRNLKYEAMAAVFRREVPLRAHAHQANDIISAVRLAEEFNVKLVIEHCTEGHKIQDFLLKHEIPAIIGPTFGYRTKIELRDMTWKTIGQLHEAGMLISLTADHPVVPLQFQTAYAAIANREGLSEQGAYEVLTINGAKILGIDDRVGSLEQGKDADIVLFEGDPLDIRTKINQVYINGENVYDRVRDADENLF